MQITVQMPDIYFMAQAPQDVNNQIKLYTALMMFYSGQVSSGAACEIAGIDRYSFLYECKKYKIPVINYSINDIEKDLNQFTSLNL